MKPRVKNKRSKNISDVESAERSDSLAKLGFLSYTAYQKSDLWSDIRSRVLLRDGGKCQGCESDANQVHHSSYDLETMSGKSLRHLQSSCGSCHMRSHFSGSAERINKKGACFACGSELVTKRGKKRKGGGLCLQCIRTRKSQRDAYKERVSR